VKFMAEFKKLDERAFAKTKARAGAPKAVSARFDRRSRRVVVRLNTGIDLAFDPRRAQGLENARPEDLHGVEVEGAGGTLHFPRLDADFSVAGLLEGFLGSLDWRKRDTRAAASRANGAKGGRPRKEAAATV
jgi:hypothetical protein